MRWQVKTLLVISIATMLVAMVMVINPRPAHAWGGQEQVPLDFLTGGGWIVRDSGAKANFGVEGGVKNGAWWGGVNYIDHGTGLHVQGRDVTAYIFIDDRTRDICGHAGSDQFGDVAFHVRATDNGEPGRDDLFIIRIGKGGAVVYTTEGDRDHSLGGAGSGGGNIQLHKGNNSNTAPSTPPVCEI